MSRYVFESMRTRVQQAGTEVELDVLRDLVSELYRCKLLTDSKYRDLDFMICDRLSTLVLEVNI